MSWGEEQKKEIETIRERKITVKLSDADCDRLARRCGEYGLTIGNLIENFIGDLVEGTYSNGSDERAFADQWFERCWFALPTEPTLLNHLLRMGYSPEDYLHTLHIIKDTKEEIELTKKHIAEPGDEWMYHFLRTYDDKGKGYVEKPSYNSVEEYIASERDYLEEQDQILINWKNLLENMIEDWKPEKEPNMDEEIELIKKWVKEKNDFRYGV